MKFKYFLSALVFLFSIAINAQEQDKDSSKKPTSIYTLSAITINENGFSAINEKLKLSNFKFVYVDGVDLDINRFSINSKYFGKKPSGFIYDDFKRYQDKNLLKGFLLKNDPTRWNLQCPQPNVNL